ncbi:MAG: FHA domain-containing protein, partial [Sandaracinaceae bacterium]|nr:FHA domain-containing protein [Sandaracinaceae bacterium]
MTIDMGGGAVETLTVPEVGPVVIGRDAGCHVVLPSPDVSRRHLTVEQYGYAYLVTDASANGTMIGESLLHRATVEAPGDVPMRVGPYVIRLAPLAVPVAAPVSAPRAAPPPPVGSPVAPPPTPVRPRS